MKFLKKIFIRATLFLAGIFLSILLAEAFVRIFYPESRDHVLPSGFYKMDNYLGWMLEKKASEYHQSKYFNVKYSTNFLGFRDDERNIKKNDKYRVLLYGDSQIFGWGIPAEKRFSNLLENSIQKVEIWNLAVPGYGLDQQVLSYKKNGAFLKANAVIFFVSDYTLSRINYDYLYQKSKPKFVHSNSMGLSVMPPEKPGMFKSIFDNSIRWMYLPFFLEEKISVLADKPVVKGQLSKTDFDDGNKINDLEEKIIFLAKDLAVSRNDSMIILVNSYSLKGKEIKDFCIQNGIICFDVNFNEKKDSLILGSEDGHWNSKANKIIFNQLLPEIKQLTDEKSEYYHINLRN